MVQAFMALTVIPIESASHVRHGPRADAILTLTLTPTGACHSRGQTI